MTGDKISLQAQLRETGKSTCRALRRNRRVPAVVYGPNQDNVEISLEEKELVKYLKSKFENTIFTLKSDDKNVKGLQVLRTQTDIHPVTRRPTHVDFYALDLKASIQVEVEVIFEGSAAGVREGGVLNVAHREVEIECLPSDIPESLTIDITKLDIGDSLHVSDLTVPTGIKILTPEERTLCTIAMVEEVKEPEVPAEGEGVEAADAEGTEGEAAPAGEAAVEGEAEEKKEEPKKKD